jgi:cell shape-determining protein MreC
MNANRRKRLREILRKLEEAQSEIESVRDDEDEARDNMPESLQESDRYTFSAEASDAMDNAVGNVSEAISAIEEIM